jgi:hypothetical protein
MKLTRKQKQDLAFALMSAAANLVETLGDKNGYNADLDIDPKAAAQQLANWLKNLPGNSWDTRLPQPE